MPIPLQRSTKLNISHWYFDHCLYPIKTSSSIKNTLSKRFSTPLIRHVLSTVDAARSTNCYVCMYVRNFFTHIHYRWSSSMVNLIAVTILLLTSGLDRCWQRIFTKNTNYFCAFESTFHSLFYLKFSFKLATFSKSYARKQKWMFFSEHSAWTCEVNITFFCVSSLVEYSCTYSIYCARVRVRW